MNESHSMRYALMRPKPFENNLAWIRLERRREI